MSDEFAMVRCNGSANLAHIHLAEEGIQSFVFDDQTADIYCGLTSSPDGERLLVKSADEQRAREILTRIPNSADAEQIAFENDNATDYDDSANDPPQLLARLRASNDPLAIVIIWLFALFVL